MSDLSDLYQELIIDHNRAPRNRGKLEDCDFQARGYNPRCGDQVTVYLKVRGNVVTDVTFDGSGCAISTASASLMTESVKGKTVAEVKSLFQLFRGLLTGENGDPGDRPSLGKLEVFSGVCKYPARVKCATLAWHTVNAAMEKDNHVVSTE